MRSFRRAVLGGTIGFVLGISPAGLPAGEPASAKGPPAGDLKPERAAEARDFRARTNKALSAAFPATSAERRTQAEKLVSLYKQIGAAKEITGPERSRLQARLKSRLARLADAIAADLKQAQAKQAETASQARTSSASASDAATTSQVASSQVASGATAPGSKGGGPQDDGQALVELIQATIAPQSWDVNGGPGTIVYWPAWHVLVVRQTDEVHEQIGGAMHAMRK